MPLLDLAVAQFNSADNMTDELAALSALIDSPLRLQKKSIFAAIARTSLNAFYRKHKGDRNIVDTWFATQAASPSTDLAGVKALMKHREFSMQVPNRMRAVVGAFTYGNLVQFHHRSGSGYAFLADVVRELDAFNPQIAARMIEPLTDWRRYDEERKALMCKELVQLYKEKLSKGVMEKIVKSLA
jgi:aminopeptidase N